MAKQQHKASDALTTVCVRNSFYSDHYRFSLILFFLLIVINISLFFTLVNRVMVQPKPQYFATSSEGSVIAWQALDRPAVSDSFVIEWTTQAVRKTFSLDFMHWRSQLQSGADYFTPFGWKAFTDSLSSSNNLKTLTDLKMVSDVQITGAPKILKKAVISGRYAWKINLPILLRYTNPARSITMPMSVTVIVLRAPVDQYPSRIAINNFLPVPIRTEGQQL